jgi:predicted amidophosphoribosyltransferase
MQKFTIYANQYLKQDIQGYYHDEYQGGGNWRIPGTIENLITTFKNDIPPYKDEETLQSAGHRLAKILKKDLLKIEQNSQNELTVCIIPRAKAENTYNQNQLLFKKVIQDIIYKLNFLNGSDYIKRHTNTRTTHKNRAGYGGDGDMPYPGITKDTCHISSDVTSKDILLIDDLYTKTINIDEDAIQALLDNGANSVIFYAVGKTI